MLDMTMVFWCRYYVILFLEIFDWLSDVFFIAFDLADPRLEAGSDALSVRECVVHHSMPRLAGRAFLCSIYP